MWTRLATGAAARPSSFHKGGIGADVLTSGAFTTGATRTPKDDDADNEDDDVKDTLLDDATTTATLGE
jgi:hypothetical protein